MIKRVMAALGVSVGLVLALTGLAVAEEANIEYTGGLTISTTEKGIVISDYDYDKDQEVEMEYVLGPESKIVNANALSEVGKGTWVEISYKLETNQRVITELLVESAEPETAPEAAPEAATQAS